MARQTEGSRAGRPRTQPLDQVSSTLRFDPALWRWFRQYALDNDTSVNAIVTELMVGFRAHHLSARR